MRRPRPFPTDAAHTVAAWAIDQVADRILDRLDAHLDGRAQITPAALKPPDAGTYIGCSESHIRRLIRCGELAAIRSTAESGTGTILIRVAELDRYLAEEPPA